MSNYQRQKQFSSERQQQRVDLSRIKFRDEIGNLRRELLTTEAESIAKNFEERGLTNTQLRKFYNEVKALEAQIEATTEGDETKQFKKNEAMIAMLKSKVAYAVNKPQGEKVKELKNFIDSCVDKIRTLQDFKDFTIFFESVVGFTKLRG